MIAVRKDGKINTNNMNRSRTLTYHLTLEDIQSNVTTELKGFSETCFQQRF
jgi:hypothetical protein